MNNFQDPENPNINQDKQSLMGQQERSTFFFKQILLLIYILCPIYGISVLNIRLKEDLIKLKKT